MNTPHNHPLAEADERFMEALLDEHARLGSGDDKALLALVRARTEEQPGNDHVVSARSFGVFQWSQVAAAVVLIGFVLSAALRHFAPGNPSSESSNHILAARANGIETAWPPEPGHSVQSKRGTAAPHNDLALPAFDGLRLPMPVTEPTSAAEVVAGTWQSPLTSPLSTLPLDTVPQNGGLGFEEMRSLLAQGSPLPKGALSVSSLLSQLPPSEEFSASASLTVSSAACPWDERHQLVQIVANTGSPDQSPAVSGNPAARSFVFLIDTSGSMGSDEKLPAIRIALSLLSEELAPDDRIAIVTYAGNETLALPATPAREKSTIRKAIERLRAGGPATQESGIDRDGASGIELAYRIASENSGDHSLSKVILCTDGDLDFGLIESTSVADLVAEQARAGIDFAICDFSGQRGGRRLRGESPLANVIASLDQVSIQQLTSLAQVNDAFHTLCVGGYPEGGARGTALAAAPLIVEFNPAQVARYRLLGQGSYASRQLTALYEVEVADRTQAARSADAPELKYQSPGSLQTPDSSRDLLTARFDSSEIAVGSRPASPSWRNAGPYLQLSAVATLFANIVESGDAPDRRQLRLIGGLLDDCATAPLEGEAEQLRALISQWYQAAAKSR